jgi:hypothetical protein
MNDVSVSDRAGEAPSREELERDRRLELVLDECVRSCSAAPWEADLAARVMACRPFAPWEVRRARAWKAPALAAAGLLAASIGLFVAPLWTLGPGTALEVWVRIMAAGTAGGVPAFLASAPVLADALGSALSGTQETRGALAGGLLASAGAVAFLARRLFLRRSGLHAASRG